jgi:hypothetical protein
VGDKTFAASMNEGLALFTPVIESQISELKVRGMRAVENLEKELANNCFDFRRARRHPSAPTYITSRLTG